jgi:hypothetical protein
LPEQRFSERWPCVDNRGIGHGDQFTRDRVPGTQHIEPLTTRSGPDENPRERPEATHERPEYEMGRVDEKHMTLPRESGVQLRLQFRVEKLRLGFDVLGQVFLGGTGIARTHCHFMPRSLRNLRT